MNFLMLLLSWVLLVGLSARVVAQDVAAANPEYDLSLVSATRTYGFFYDTPSPMATAASSGCNFVGKIVLGATATLDPNGKTFYGGQVEQASQSIMIDFINKERCGVTMAGNNYALEIRYYDDESSTDMVAKIAPKLITEVDLILAGWSSPLTKPLAKIANENQRMLIAPTATQTAIFEDTEMVFGTLPPGASIFTSVLEGLAEVGAKTVATVAEDMGSLKAVCGGVDGISADLDMTMTSSHIVELRPNTTVLDPVARELSLQDPDIVVTCVMDCLPWLQAMRNANWSPKAQAFTICIGATDFHEGAGTDAEYMIGASMWHPSIKTQDAVTGWSSQDFNDRFLKESSHEQAPYHAASFAAAISILVQAVEATNSTDDIKLAQYIASNALQTTFGKVQFDSNGQNMIPAKSLQYDRNGEIQMVYPLQGSTAPLLYPMPSWSQRDCIHRSPCSMDEQGECDRTGRCICSDPNQVPAGSAETAACIPQENFNYLPESLIIVGYCMFGVLVVAAIFSAGWTWKHQHKWIVKASQPALLGLVIVGCFISSVSILFMKAETGYRELRDPDTLESTGEENPDISKVDASCMSVYWLYGIGFVVTFSALFSKVEKVRLISRAKKEEKGKIGIKHVVHIIALMLPIEIAILTAWQIVSPYQWEREVLLEENGFPVESVGRCDSEQGGLFFIGLMGFHILSLFWALVLCFRTRHIDDDFAESDYIAQAVAFMFQVMVLAVPIGILVEDNNDIFYFVQVCTVFMQNFTVLGLMFAPKVIKNARGEGDGALPKRKESIPMAALTHCKWDEGVDLLNELLEEDGGALTEYQRDGLVNVKTLLLKRNKKMTSKEEKLSYIPSNLLQLNSKANHFILQEFGGVVDDGSDNKSVSGFSMTSSTRQSLSFSSDDFNSGNVKEGNMHVPPEFEALSAKQKEQLHDMLSLSSLKQWGFNIFDLVKVTGGNPLLFVGWAVLGSPYSQRVMAEACGKDEVLVDQEGYNFTDKKVLNIPMRTLCDYLREIENDYQSENPYHNEIHAADVLQSLHSMIQMMGDTSLKPTKEELFAILLAAAVHDVKHPGRNNGFQSQAVTGFALTHNNTSVLENVHVSHAFRTMLGLDDTFDVDESRPNDIKKCDKQLNVLRNLKRKQFDTVRDKMIDAILHTDMSKHFQLVSAMKGIAIARQEAANETLTSREEVWQILVYMLHMADISGQAKPAPLHLLWTDRVSEEFFQQGDEEAALGMEISFLCNRATVNVPQSQHGYVNFVVKPAYDALGQLFPTIQEKVLPFVESNLAYWEIEKERSQQFHNVDLNEDDGGNLKKVEC